MARHVLSSLSMRVQATVAHPVSVHGIGLHTGRPVEVILHPLGTGRGISFFRRDTGTAIPATTEEAGRLDYATSLGTPGNDVSTVEHLLSATAGLGITNLLVEVDGPELPILDGSALPWVRAIQRAGIVRQGAAIPIWRPSRTLSVSAPGGKHLEIRPSRDLRVTYSIDFPSRVIGRQSLTVVVTPETYTHHVAPARTFGFLAEYEWLKSKGLARGASAENCIVVGDDRIENGDLRFPDEFVRHKVLDLLGDLVLVGQPIAGHIVASRAGHAIHAQLARAIREEIAQERLFVTGNAETSWAAAGR